MKYTCGRETRSSNLFLLLDPFHDGGQFSGETLLFENNFDTSFNWIDESEELKK